MPTLEIIKNLFGSNTRVKLLDLFLNGETKPYYVREITRLISEQINSVRRELINLEETGLVKKSDKDRKVYYQVNKDSKLYNPLKVLLSNDVGQDTKAELASSTTGDELIANSDIDWQNEVADIKKLLNKLLVFNKHGAQVDMLVVGDNSTAQLSTWASAVEKRFDQEMRYVILSPKEYAYRLSAKDKFICDLLNCKHRVIYDTSNVE